MCKVNIFLSGRGTPAAEVRCQTKSSPFKIIDYALTECKNAKMQNSNYLFSGNVKLTTSNDPLKALAKNCEPQDGANFAGSLVDVFSTALADEGKVESPDLISRNGCLI